MCSGHPGAELYRGALGEAVWEGARHQLRRQDTLVVSSLRGASAGSSVRFKGLPRELTLRV